MDAEHALADLMEVSSQVEAAVLLDAEGAVQASTLTDSSRADRLASVARELLEAAGAARSGSGSVATQVEVSTRGGSVFVVRDGGRTIAAATPPSPTSGLVLYDLRTALRRLDEEPAPKPRRRRKKAGAGDAS